MMIIWAVMALPFVSCAGWSLYDGMVYYPKLRERSLEYERLQQEFPETWPAKWRTVAEARGWPTDDPGPPKSETDILTQYILAGICGASGLIAVTGAIVFGVLLKRTTHAATPDMVFSDEMTA